MTEQTTDNSDGFSLADLLSKPVELPTKKQTQQQQIKRSDLWGTGLDKKTLERAEKKLEKESARESELIEHETVDYSDVFKIELPKTLVDANLILDEYQSIAVEGLIKQRYGCLTGAAGTGKTTTTKALLARIIQEVENPHIAFCAFTGRAVQQMKRALPAEYHDHCDTIHKLLEYSPVYDDRLDENGELKTIRIFVPMRTALNPLDQNIIILDEAGMVPIDLWEKLIDAITPGTRIYLIGDINQLPPVTGRSVFGFTLQKWPAYELSKIHRTEENAIIDNAWRILHGKSPQAMTGRVVMKQISDNSIDAYKQTIAVVQQLHKQKTFNPLRDAIIVPQNIGNLGQEQLNEYLCPYFNTQQKNEQGIVLNPRYIITAGYNHVAFSVGDKVMVTQNDRDRGLTNGMIGVIERLTPNQQFKGQVVGDMAAASLADDFNLEMEAMDAALQIQEERTKGKEDDPRERQASHVVTIRFQNIDEPMEFSTAGAINTLKHAYAMTCHKAQGGEFPVVVILLHSANIRMLTREWLYTAFTRAQEKVILLYNPRGLQQALNCQTIKGKTLQEKAQRFIELQNKAANGDGDITVPTLPEPEEIVN